MTPATDSATQAAAQALVAAAQAYADLLTTTHPTRTAARYSHRAVVDAMAALTEARRTAIVGERVTA